MPTGVYRLAGPRILIKENGTYITELDDVGAVLEIQPVALEVEVFVDEGTSAIVDIEELVRVWKENCV